MALVDKEQPVEVCEEIFRTLADDLRPSRAKGIAIRLMRSLTHASLLECIHWSNGAVRKWEEEQEFNRRALAQTDEDLSF
jgi:hypothetical protein